VQPDGVDRLVADEDADVDLAEVGKLLRGDRQLQFVPLWDDSARQSVEKIHFFKN
jgi:hypothetical protein